MVFEIWSTDTFYGPEQNLQFFLPTEFLKLKYDNFKSLKMGYFTGISLKIYCFQAKVKNFKFEFLDFGK